jgi:hypothetical protein
MLMGDVLVLISSPFVVQVAMMKAAHGQLEFSCFCHRAKFDLLDYIGFVVEQWLPCCLTSSLVGLKADQFCESNSLLPVAPLGVSLLFRDTASSYDKVSLIGTSSRP